MNLEEQNKIRLLLSRNLKKRGITLNTLSKLVPIDISSLSSFFEGTSDIDFLSGLKILRIIGIDLHKTLNNTPKIKTPIKSRDEIVTDLQHNVEIFLKKKNFKKISNVYKGAGVSENCIRRLMKGSCPSIENQMKLYVFFKNEGI